ncbi:MULTISPECIES: hypothetical protein [unclassified Pseudofrankia]|uniref:hypothetical protein n=1 Tax=unclassified Pseudofrankia TaxID=2994372 RepID=UPI0012FF8550|nr:MULTISPECIES: hypothetical protein [unclassified Pseudofrankia]MDT3442376.1 hypothetical protein [Pseudofrankia sp. BMG5.37]
MSLSLSRSLPLRLYLLAFNLEKGRTYRAHHSPRHDRRGRASGDGARDGGARRAPTG